MKLQNNYAITEGYRKRQKKYLCAVIFLVILVLILAFAMMIYGNTVYKPSTILRVLKGENIKGASFTIMTLRLPRMCAAVLCGISFGMAGNTFQKLLGNPLASPDIIGISAGSNTAAVFGILILGLDSSTVSVLAVISGLFVSGLIYILSQGNGFSSGRLILTGIGIQAFLNAVLSWMLLKASEYDVPSALHWLSGSLNGVRMKSIPPLAIVVALAGTGILLLNRHLSVLQLGDAYAATLGVSLNATRLMLIFLSLFLIAFATSVTGPMSSVAFLAGPIAARISGGGNSNMVTSALTGAVLVTAADCIGQFLLPARYPAGIITGILGAPYLLFLLLCMNRKGE